MSGVSKEEKKDTKKAEKKKLSYDEKRFKRGLGMYGSKAVLTSEEFSDLKKERSLDKNQRVAKADEKRAKAKANGYMTPEEKKKARRKKLMAGLYKYKSKTN